MFFTFGDASHNLEAFVPCLESIAAMKNKRDGLKFKPVYTCLYSYPDILDARIFLVNKEEIFTDLHH